MEINLLILIITGGKGNNTVNYQSSIKGNKSYIDKGGRTKQGKEISRTIKA